MGFQLQEVEGLGGSLMANHFSLVAPVLDSIEDLNLG